MRVDTHIYPGYKISPYYDSMVAKLIVHGRNRKEAISTMKRALEEFYISPIKSTISLQQKIMSHPKFISGDVTTHFLEEMGRLEEKETAGGRL